MNDKPMITESEHNKDGPPQPPKGRSPVSKLLYLALIPVALIAIGSWQAWSWWQWANSPAQSSDAPSAEKGILVKIDPGSTGQAIGQTLAKKGLIRSADAWNLWLRWQRSQKGQAEFKAGTYQLSPTQPMSSIAEKILKGEVIQVTFTIPEGWSLQQMANYFETQGFFSAQEFLTATRQIPYDKYPWLPPGLPHLEGFLAPDTYKIGGDLLSPQGVIEQMLDHFQEVALPLYQKAQAENRTKMSIKDWVTLASIVEKESVVASERKLIAGVFTNRLVKGIHLGADPTVEYGLGIKQTKERPLTIAEVRTPNPYNTYINLGLPPTPIASPGVASLAATLDPDQTDYLYFMAKYDGTHIFSRTLEEHNAAINQVERQINSGQ